MNEPSKRDTLLVELERERSVRRIASLLSAIAIAHCLDELDRLIGHLSWLVSIPRKTAEDPQSESDILIEAARADRRSDLYRFGNSASSRTSRLVSDSVIAVDFTAIFGNFY